MTPQTPAGRALLNGHAPIHVDVIAAIEREAKQQERERALTAIEDAYKLGNMGYSSLLTIRAILADEAP